jgi:phosphoribosylformylglycinamidine cyclo-ligase
VVEKSEILDGKSIRPGDVIIGLASSGLHTNGYSLARKILFEQMRLEPRQTVPGLRGSVGQELLKVHLSYGPLVRGALKKFNRSKPRRSVIKGLAHVTGGGFIDNIPRVLPKNCDALIRKGSWEVLPIFEILAREGQIAEAELYQVFNMGIGMVMIAAAEAAGAVLKFAQTQKARAWVIGEIARGRGEVKIV